MHYKQILTKHLTRQIVEAICCSVIFVNGLKSWIRSWLIARWTKFLIEKYHKGKGTFFWARIWH